MGTKDRLIDRADRRARRLTGEFGRDIRLARVAAGLSQGSLSEATGISQSAISRIELGDVESLTVALMARLSEAVGLDLSVRTFPSGDPLRDAAQLSLLERLRVRLHPSVRMATEVPIPVPGDRRAWDACLFGAGWMRPVEAETVIHDAQAMERRIALKARDTGVDNVVLLVASTKANRLALTAIRSALRPRFPFDSRAVLEAVGSGHDPGAGIVII